MEAIELKEMPFQEKYEATLDFINLYKSFVPVFIHERLGDEAEADSSSCCSAIHFSAAW